MVSRERHGRPRLMVDYEGPTINLESIDILHNFIINHCQPCTRYIQSGALLVQNVAINSKCKMNDFV